MKSIMFKLGKMPTGLDLLNYFVGLTTLYWAAAASVAISAIQSDKASKAAKSAAGAQKEAADTATAEQRRQFDVSQQQAEPFRQAGLQALGQQQALLGLSGVPAQQEALQQFQESPGQSFLRERGEQAILRQASATGGLGGARVQEALQQQGIGFAQQDLQNQLARLAGMAGQGQAVTGNIAQLGAGMAANVGNLAMQGGQAQASGILGAQQAQARPLSMIQAGLTGGSIGQQTPGVGFQQGFASGLSRF